MHTPDYFKITDETEIFRFIKNNGFGQIISSLQGKITSSHIPFLLSDDQKSLFGHFGRMNPQHTELENQELLITLEGPHDYISPTWYTADGVPTWNYQAVHIYGNCTLINDQAALKTIVNNLTDKYEKIIGTHWQPNYNESMLKHIVGFELEITDIQCQYKLSQNKSIQDRENIAKELDNLKAKKLAKAMRDQ